MLISKICIRNILLLAVINIGILSFSFTALHGEDLEAGEETVEGEKIYRSPFSLPAGVKFVKKEEKEKIVPGIYSGSTEWAEGEIASSLNGIFRSGGNITANINGKWVKVGDQTGEEQVLDIRKDVVILLGKGNEKRELSLQRSETYLKVINKVKPETKEEK